MNGLLRFVLAILLVPFRSKARLQAENAALRHQVIILHRKSRGRVCLSNADRWFFVQLYRLFPSIAQALHILRPETLVRWHRAGFRGYWRWKSRKRGGRPQIDTELRALIREMSRDNPLWGAPRIHGELLKLGFEVAQSTVAKYMMRRHGPRGQGWWTFMRNHAPEIAAMDLFVVPTLAFNVLYGLLILRIERRELVWVGVTTSPTADWIARQITEAFDAQSIRTMSDGVLQEVEADIAEAERLMTELRFKIAVAQSSDEDTTESERRVQEMLKGWMLLQDQRAKASREPITIKSSG